MDVDSRSLNSFRQISMDIHQCPGWIVRSVCPLFFLLYSGFQSMVIAVEPTPLTTVQVANGLTAPLYVTHAPGDFDRVFIVGQNGSIRILDISQEPPQLMTLPFLDIQSRVRFSGERGLLGMAFHPDYAANGRFFVNYSDTQSDTVVAEYTVSKDPNLANTTEKQLLKIDQPETNHNGGWIAFGPDGYLYIASGDGGSSINAQSLDILLGKMLRIDVDRDDFPEDATKNYGIPSDNPFVGIEGSDEIWAYGLRNPWRNAFDRRTGDLYIADVGAGSWEEINFQSGASIGGENYGWSCMEAERCTSSGECICFDDSLTDPIHSYSHNSGCSITGGEVYRGCAIPDLSGTYFFADLCSDQIWSFRYEGGIVTQFTDRTVELDPSKVLNIESISSFGLDAAGEMYVCDLGGEVYKIVPAISPPEIQLIETIPPHLAIDARQPSQPDGSEVVGWDSLELVFDGAFSCPNISDFVVSQLGGMLGAPGIASLEILDVDRIKLRFDRIIEVGSWLVVTHEATGSQIQIGYLPGDVDANQQSNAQDVESLMDVLSIDPQSRPLWSMDVDRSGMVGAGDLLRLIDLLNGAGVYDPFVDATLP